MKPENKLGFKMGSNHSLSVLFICLLLFVAPSRSDPDNQATNPDKMQYSSPGDSFKFECPRIMQPHSIEHLQVVWTRDSAIWVKIIDGRPQITYKLKSIHVQKIHNRDFITLASNNRRYSFVYDALNAKFSMSIDSLLPTDTGVWTCEVIFRRMHDANDQTAIDYRDLRVSAAPITRTRATVTPVRSIAVAPTIYGDRARSRQAKPSAGGRIIDHRQPSKSNLRSNYRSKTGLRGEPRGQDRYGPVTYSHANPDQAQQIVTFSRVKPTGRSGGRSSSMSKSRSSSRYGRRYSNGGDSNHEAYGWRRLLYIVGILVLTFVIPT